MNDGTDLLWAKGLIYHPPIWPFKGSIVSSKTYHDVMRRERRNLYMRPELVEMVYAREEAGLHWECLELGKRLRSQSDTEEHKAAN